ncbi:MAG: cupin domain-containing protein, partial [Acidimicrobiales bacterium]
MMPEPRVWSREEMMTRVAIFDEQQGSFTGLQESHLPQCEKELINIIGFRPPTEEGVFSPVGSDSASASAIDIFEGFNLG